MKHKYKPGWNKERVMEYIRKGNNEKVCKNYNKVIIFTLMWKNGLKGM